MLYTVLIVLCVMCYLYVVRFETILRFDHKKQNLHTFVNVDFCVMLGFVEFVKLVDLIAE